MADLSLYVLAVLAVVGGILLLGFRRRILLRIGVRNFLRRKSQVALAIAGLFVATSIISSSLVMGDSFNVTVRDIVFRSSHLVDEVVWIENESGTRTHTGFLNQPKGFFNESVSDDLRARIDEMPHVDGVEPRILASLAVRDLDTGFIEPSGRLIGFDPLQDFDEFVRQGVSYRGADLPRNGTILNARLAAHLEAKIGDQIQLFTALGPANFTLHSIVDNEAKGGFFGDAIAFVLLADAQAFLGAPGKVNAIFVSNVGGIRDGQLATDDATLELAAILGQPYSISPLKKAGLQEAEDSIEWVTQLFAVLGIFTILAGILLIANIFVVLAEERKSEMGISRALGMRRLHLTETFIFEGLLYALSASAIGSVAGLGVAAFIIFAFRALLSNIQFAPTYYVEPASLVIAFALGFLVTMAVVTLASWRVSRLNIVRAVRNIPEPLVRHGSWRQWALGAFGLSAGLGLVWLAIQREDNLLAMVGPTLVAYGVAGVVQRLVGARAAYTGAALAVVAYALYPPRFEFYPTESPPVDAFVVSGVLLVLSAIVVIMYNNKPLLGALTRLAGNRRLLRPVVKTAVSYPMARKGRTGLTLAMFALVVFIITVTSMFGALFLGNVEQLLRDQSGGYDIGARAAIQRPGANFDADLASAGVAASIAYYTAFNGSVATIVGEASGPIRHPVYGIPAGFSAQNAFPFLDLDPSYPSPRAAWDAVEADPTLAIFDGSYGGGFGATFAIAAGERIRLSNGLEERNFTVVGLLREFLIPGVFVQEPVARNFFFAGAPSAFLFKVGGGATPSVVERELERDFVAYGMDAAVFREVIEEITEINLSFIRIMQAFLALGLIVGVAGLGVVTMRNVVERKNEIGTLRAIGFRQSMVLKYLLIENSFVSLLGIGLGMAAGIAYAYDIFDVFLGETESPFLVPWGDLALVGLIAYGCGLVTMLPPSRKAARLPPAEALRIVE